MSAKPVFQAKDNQWHCPVCNSTNLHQLIFATTSRPLATKDGQLTAVRPNDFIREPCSPHGHCLECATPLDLKGLTVVEIDGECATPLIWDEAKHEWLCPHCGHNDFFQHVAAQNYVVLSTHNQSTLVESDDFNGSWENIQRLNTICGNCQKAVSIPDNIDTVERSNLP